MLPLSDFSGKQSRRFNSYLNTGIGLLCSTACGETGQHKTKGSEQPPFGITEKTGIRDDLDKSGAEAACADFLTLWSKFLYVFARPLDRVNKYHQMDGRTYRSETFQFIHNSVAVKRSHFSGHTDPNAIAPPV